MSPFSFSTELFSGFEIFRRASFQATYKLRTVLRVFEIHGIGEPNGEPPLLRIFVCSIWPYVFLLFFMAYYAGPFSFDILYISRLHTSSILRAKIDDGNNGNDACAKVEQWEEDLRYDHYLTKMYPFASKFWNNNRMWDGRQTGRGVGVGIWEGREVGGDFKIVMDCLRRCATGCHLFCCDPQADYRRCLFPSCRLLSKLREINIVPAVITYNAGIIVCGEFGKWEEALR